MHIILLTNCTILVASISYKQSMQSFDTIDNAILFSKLIIDVKSE